MTETAEKDGGGAWVLEGRVLFWLVGTRHALGGTTKGHEEQTGRCCLQSRWSWGPLCACLGRMFRLAASGTFGRTGTQGERVVFGRTCDMFLTDCPTGESV